MPGQKLISIPKILDNRVTCTISNLIPGSAIALLDAHTGACLEFHRAGESSVVFKAVKSQEIQMVIRKPGVLPMRLDAHVEANGLEMAVAQMEDKTYFP